MKKIIKITELAFLFILIFYVVHVKAQDRQYTLDYQSYGFILEKYVTSEGLIDYAAVSGNRSKLDEFLKTISEVTQEQYVSWNKYDKIAFWINSYNAITLKTVIENYPINTKKNMEKQYPLDSMKQIPGAWKKTKHRILGKMLTLDRIKKDILRANFNEPRIHMALVSAAMSCPYLRRGPYIGDKLDMQLDDQAKIFFFDKQNFRIDKNNSVIYLSSIFKWYGADFLRESQLPVDSGLSKAERSIMSFVRKYLSDHEKEYISGAGYELRYLEFDWMLNDLKNKEYRAGK
ncbi:DUF547 domain-containing protein [Elusimicrobiota bacterium]